MKKQISVREFIKYIPYAVCILSLIILAVLFVGDKIAASGKGYSLIIEENRVTGINITGDGEIHVVIPEGVVGIESEAFFGKKQMVSVVIPASVEYIGYQAFVNCEALKKVEFQENSVLTEIHTSAFRGCNSLAEITLPDRVLQINSWAFSECTSLKSITIPGSVRALYRGCFGGCDALSEINFEEKDGWSVYVSSFIYNNEAEEYFTYNGVAIDGVSWSFYKNGMIAVDVDNGSDYVLQVLKSDYVLIRYGE